MLRPMAGRGTTRTRIAALGLALLAGPAGAEEAPSVHRDAMLRHWHDPSFTARTPPSPPPSPAPREISSTRVFGYLPYWSDDYLALRWDVLTDVAWFALSLGTDGQIESDHGWGEEGSFGFVEHARAQGVRSHLTAVLFGGSELEDLFASPTAPGTAIASILDAAEQVGVDGINVDFEGLPSGNRDDFVDFVAEFRAETLARGMELSLAMPAVDWSGAFDYDVLAENTDGLFIMGYGYHWSDGNPGPVAPRDGGGIWSDYSLSWTIADYLEWAGEWNRGKIVLGLPLYGYDWPSASHDVPGDATGTGTAVTYTVTGAGAPGDLWDATTSTPYRLYTDGGARQLWYDDATSVLAKAELVTEHALGGVGFWALGYDGNDPAIWDPLAELLEEPPEDDEEPGDDDSASEDTEGPVPREDALVPAGGDDPPTPPPGPDPPAASEPYRGCRCAAEGRGGSPAWGSLLVAMAVRRRLRGASPSAVARWTPRTR